MPITDQNAITQGLANIKLESLKLSEEIIELIENDLREGTIDSSDILELLRG
ncbi:hypothetical protein MNBD_GAMMA13-979 [hydrothermal vent metagenome]|uniref:Uncharacterized protein n=1 Tax=hydrothermal vent metagenome TaxID=652676 RepID=A0A3B0YFM9_9ZZZZ